ncbi:methyltransferase domain-containing protein [Streptomyces sp. NPDC005898]|uniref:methyltransferase domain-containing protein n=1 Tax=Streptomyces sp. NPDC005898 TaxID=3157082 RepID=UPI0033F65857
MEWTTCAARLAEEVAHPVSRWREALATTPRHLFVPRWWKADEGRWWLQDGPQDPEAWMAAAYSNRTLVTRVGEVHADQAKEEQADGLPTSSSTLPSLVVQMYRHAMMADDSDILVTAGTGYGTALACARLGSEHVTSVDVDPYLVAAAADRLHDIGHHPQTAVCDITGPLPGTFDRIIATVSTRGVPAPWLRALRPGGRLVTTLAGTWLIVTADKQEDGSAIGRVEADRASFMTTRQGADYPPNTGPAFKEVSHLEGEEVSMGRFPVLNVPESYDVWSMLELTVPGIQHYFSHDADRGRKAWMIHPDGSWARAEGVWKEFPTVHQGGPRRLYDDLERIRLRLNMEGALPLTHARVEISPEGVCTISRGAWRAEIE